MLSLAALLIAAPGSLKLPSIFSDHMVLQRQQPIPIFGTATPGAQIEVRFAGKFATATANSEGVWQVKFRPMEAGGPYQLSVSGDGTVERSDIMVGEVWVASGQSNMEWVVSQQNEVELAQQEATPSIRMFTVKKASTELPAKDVEGAWIPADRDSVLNFSAVGYWFANDLRKKLNVPIGVIHTSWGGTPAESWTRRTALKAEPSLTHLVDNYLTGIQDYPERKAAYDKALAEWNAKAYATDTSNEGYFRGYADFNRFTNDWNRVTLPNLLEVTEKRDMNGAVWYRREFEVSSDQVGQPMRLELGPIDDFDVTYVNGRRVGTTDESTQYWYAVARKYEIPAALIRPGKNVIAVRVFDQSGRGGFTGPAHGMRIVPLRKGDPIPLAGEWLSKVERFVEPPTEEFMRSQPQAPFGPGHPWVPGGLWNAMVDPLVPYGIRGAIWYQGESNAGRAFQYRTLFSEMIADWRKAWGIGDFPFYFVQLANYTARLPEPAPSEWAELREAQDMARKLPNTGMAVTIDIGEANDIHPRNKREVGRRLALNALRDTYGLDLIAQGPSFDSLKVDDNKVIVKFNSGQGLKTSDGRAPVGFAIAGEDRKFVWASAEIVGETVVLSSPSVPNPVAVRYAWANNPETNLYNGAGLPAEPFRTDKWPGLTDDRK